MNKSQFSNFANLVQIGDMKMQPAQSEGVNGQRKTANSRTNHRETVKDRLTGWSIGPNQLHSKGSTAEVYFGMTPLKTRSRGSMIKTNEGSLVNTESCLTPLRVNFSAKKSKKAKSKIFNYDYSFEMVFRRKRVRYFQEYDA